MQLGRPSVRLSVACMKNESRRRGNVGMRGGVWGGREDVASSSAATQFLRKGVKHYTPFLQVMRERRRV